MPPPHPLRISARVVYLDSTVQLQKLPRVAERHAELSAVLACSVFSAVPYLRKFANWAPAVLCSVRGSSQRDCLEFAQANSKTRLLLQYHHSLTN